MRDANLNSEGACGAICGGGGVLLVDGEDDGLDRVMITYAYDV